MRISPTFRADGRHNGRQAIASARHQLLSSRNDNGVFRKVARQQLNELPCGRVVPGREITLDQLVHNRPHHRTQFRIIAIPLTKFAERHQGRFGLPRRQSLPTFRQEAVLPGLFQARKSR